MVNRYSADFVPFSLPVGSSSSSMPRPVVLGEAVKDHQSRHKPLRKIASVEGLTAEEIETVTRLLVREGQYHSV